jgi:hypothetical protein
MTPPCAPLTDSAFNDPIYETVMKHSQLTYIQTLIRNCIARQQSTRDLQKFAELVREYGQLQEEWTMSGIWRCSGFRE